ncbi:MAG TPA: tetraacyldisaccharide 4'-kinase [Bryobacteraceae bacterium]|nr:tetraacyldisaccharide 4'-kinase [Bryobacteraceae bacterium]
MRLRLIYLLYRILQWFALPAIVAYFLRRVLKDRRYLTGFPERLGFLPSHWKHDAGGAVWLHAVSVGEVLALVGLVSCLRRRLAGVPLFVSVSTLAGRAVAEQRLAPQVEGIFFAPLDYCFAVRRVLRAIRPSLVVVVETEIWPNLYREARRAGCGLLLVNARISDRAAPRYRRLKWFFGPVLGLADRILAQGAASQQRYCELLSFSKAVEFAGNLKYDFNPQAVRTPAAVEQWIRRLRPSEILIAASTMPPAFPGDVDEDQVVIEVFRELAAERPGLVLIHAPRKPEQFDAVAEKLARAGVAFVRRSALDRELPACVPPCVLLLDSVGELSGLFPMADAVFMGGTLAERGGHNVLEPAFFGRAVVIGPHMENFPEIAADFRRAGACVEIGSAQELAEVLRRLLDDQALREEVGGRAKSVAESKRGAAERAAEAACELYGRAIPRFRPAWPWWPVLWALSRLWIAGVCLKRAWDSKRRQRLATPVISAGNLAMGGTGKTPFVAWLVRSLSAAGLRPAILTRGYGRRGRQDPLIVAPGEQQAVEQTGEEAQILMRATRAPVGISARRSVAARQMEERFNPDVFVLDDGFQHWRVARDLDIVLLDGLAPFGANGEVFPLGSLREPAQALERASLIVVTRAEATCPRKGIEAVVRRYNARAPIFYSRIVPLYWEDAAGGERWEPGRLPFRKMGAFCGLGNPAAFWRTLRQLGYRPEWRVAFADHHRYSVKELERMKAAALALGLEALLTTEKDVLNFCEGGTELLAPIRVCRLKMDIELEQQERFLEWVTKALRAGGFRSEAKPISRGPAAGA